MGAVFLLVCLPLVAALGFMLKTTQGESSNVALLAGGVFIFLSYIITRGVVSMAREWDETEAER
jgi:hypothetical protein